MANIGAFSAQIVELVRSMPDEAILDLVRNQLGVLSAAAPVSFGAPRRGRPAGRRRIAAAAPAARGPSKRRGRRSGTVSAEKQAAMDAVEKVVKASSGLAASEIAQATKLPPGRVSAAIKELKAAKRIFQGGDRRFARYAGDQKTAIQASEHARATASGPIVKGRRGRKKK